MITIIDVKAIAVLKSVAVKEQLFALVFHPSGKHLLVAAEGGKLIIFK